MTEIDQLEAAISSYQQLLHNNDQQAIRKYKNNTLPKLTKQFKNYKTDARYDAEQRRRISDLIQIMLPMVISDKQDMAILCYPSFNWDDLTSGLPGSEEAVVYLSKELQKKNRRVIVWGSPEYNDWPIQDKVLYFREELFKSNSSKWRCLIVWRRYDAYEYYKRAEKRYLWLHDYLSNSTDYTQCLQNLDDVLWLSEYQRRQAIEFHVGFAKYKNICGNGVVAEQFRGEVSRKPFRCIYASNYSRGLELLLRIWPIIKAHYPDASLRIYYGWNTWTNMGKDWHLTMHNLINDLRYLDVKECGNVDHNTLARKFKKASFWLYPCSYEETFCITAVKAQIAGAVPVCFTDLGALPETVKFGQLITKVDDDKRQGQFLANVMAAFKIPETTLSTLRRQMSSVVSGVHTWENVANRWLAVFSGKSVNFNDEYKIK